MDNQAKPGERKRTIQDKLISGLNAFRFFVAEPFRLKLARLRYDYLYSNPDEYPLISVYVPTYNRGQLLVDRAVKSVLEQTYKNFEFIIIGDCCTDNTADLISQIDDPRLRFYNLPQKSGGYPDTPECRWFAGPVVAANKALKSIQGKWIARLDDDDIWTPDHLEVLLRFAQRGNYEFVSAVYIAERFGKKIVVDAENDHPRIGGTQTWLYRSYLCFFKYNIHCWRKKWDKVNDTDLQNRIYKAGTRMGFLNQVVAYVLPRPGEDTIGLEAYVMAQKEGYAVHS